MTRLSCTACHESALILSATPDADTRALATWRCECLPPVAVEGEEG